MEAALQLQRHSGVQVPSGIDVLPEFWSTSKAAMVRNVRWNAVRGNPGTAEERRKGGVVSQQRRRDHPERYTGSRVRLRNAIRIPPDGEELAEFIGIVLGDGTISNYQVRIVLNRTTDSAYGGYVANLARRLFGVTVTAKEPKGESVHRILCDIGLPAKCDGRRHVAIYRRAGVERYLEVVGTKNPKYLQRFVEWVRRGDRAAEGAALEMPCTGNPCAAGSNPAPSAMFRRGRARRGVSGAL